MLHVFKALYHGKELINRDFLGTADNIENAQLLVDLEKKFETIDLDYVFEADEDKDPLHTLIHLS